DTYATVSRSTPTGARITHARHDFLLEHPKMAGASTLHPPFLDVRRVARGCSSGRSRLFGGLLPARSPRTRRQAELRRPTVEGRPTHLPTPPPRTCASTPTTRWI